MNKTGQKLPAALSADLLKVIQAEDVSVGRVSDLKLTLKELANASDVTERTIRFYIQQGVLPPPSGAGPASRYGLEHLTRLSLVRRFKAALLPLSRIKELLTELGPTELEQVADQLYSDMTHTNPVQTGKYHRPTASLTASSPKVPSVSPDNEVLEVFYPPDDTLPIVSTRLEGGPGANPLRLEGLNFGGRWNRLALAPGLELHYEENGPQDTGPGREKLARLVELAMQLYQ